LICFTFLSWWWLTLFWWYCNQLCCWWPLVLSASSLVWSCQCSCCCRQAWLGHFRVLRLIWYGCFRWNFGYHFRWCSICQEKIEKYWIKRISNNLTPHTCCGSSCGWKLDNCNTSYMQQPRCSQHLIQRIQSLHICKNKHVELHSTLLNPERSHSTFRWKFHLQNKDENPKTKIHIFK
jgi:hypothetical protein